MNKQILLVDDDIVILKLLNFILSKDFDLVSKSSGIDAFRWLEEGNHPALVVSDLNMPYMDGMSFVKNMKVSGFYKDTPIIILSGSEELEQLIEEQSLEVAAYFKKPFNPAALKVKITEILSSK